MDAGAETSTSYLQSFVLALINFPECQKRAQRELDEVVGTDRLPIFEDFSNLPYVNAFIKEVRTQPLHSFDGMRTDVDDIGPSLPSCCASRVASLCCTRRPGQ